MEKKNKTYKVSEKATLHDVAKLSGVSISTVSRALSKKVAVKEDTYNKIMRAVKSLNYSPNLLAQGLKEGSTKTIGMIVPNINNPVFPEVAKGAEDEARRLGYQMYLCNTNEDIETELQYIESIYRRCVDGILLLTASREDNHVNQLQKHGIPIVVVIRDYGDREKIDRVTIDNIHVGYLAGKALIDRGCKRCGILTGDMGLNLYADRYLGFKKALNEAGLPFRRELLLDGSHTENNGYDVIEEAFAQGIITDGIFASCDFQSLGVVKYLQNHNIKIPEEVAVIGIDNLNLSQFCTPSITAVRQPLYACGEFASRILIERINHCQMDVQNVRLQSKLISGETA